MVLRTSVKLRAAIRYQQTQLYIRQETFKHGEGRLPFAHPAPPGDRMRILQEDRQS